MSFLLIIPYYLLWHYGIALRDIKNIWFTFIAFIYKFFSIPVLLKTLFSPWERIKDSYGSRKESFVETFIFNSMMRFVGVFIRLFFISIGFFAIATIFLLGIIFYVIWFFLPFIIINIAVWGLGEIFI